MPFACHRQCHLRDSNVHFGELFPFDICKRRSDHRREVTDPPIMLPVHLEIFDAWRSRNADMSIPRCP